MARLSIPPRELTAPETQRALDDVTRRLGFTPNLHRAMSVSGPVLASFEAVSNRLGVTLSPQIREAIGLAVSEINHCDYCINAHRYVAERFGLRLPKEGLLETIPRFLDARIAAAVRFAIQVVKSRGHTTEGDLLAVREAGFSDPEILEITAVCVQATFSNYVTSVVGSDSDFPSVEEMPA